MWHDMGETILLKTDRVYGAKAKPHDHAKLALPNPCDGKLVRALVDLARVLQYSLAFIVVGHVCQ